MTLSQYLIIQQVIMGALMSLGIQLLLQNTPKELKGGAFHRARQVMGLAMCVVPIASFVYYFAGMYREIPQYATAINLSAYCLTTTLIAWSFYIMLGRATNKHVIRANILIGLIYPIPLWLGLCLGNDFVSKNVLIAFYTFYCVIVFLHTATCFHYYNIAKKSRDNTTSRYKRVELKIFGNTMKVTLHLVAVSIVAPSFYSYPLWLGSVFIAMAIYSFIRIYINYRKMLAFSIDTMIARNDEIKQERAIEAEDKAGLSDERYVQIEKQVNMWLTTKEYLKPDVSISSVAKATYTNRTYLSRYINLAYKCSFRNWLTHLRIEEAKRMITEQPGISISEVASHVGFASTESFSHIFTRLVGTPPSRWSEPSES